MTKNTPLSLDRAGVASYTFMNICLLEREQNVWAMLLLNNVWHKEQGNKQLQVNGLAGDRAIQTDSSQTSLQSVIELSSFIFRHGDGPFFFLLKQN